MGACFNGASMRVLLVEDDRTLAESVARHLSGEHFVVDLARNGEDGQHRRRDRSARRRRARSRPAEDQDGVVGAAGLARGRPQALPVLILTARDGWSDKVDGFKAGADDFLIKPFRVEELVMRLRAMVRRAAGHASPRIAAGR